LTAITRVNTVCILTAVVVAAVAVMPLRTIKQKKYGDGENRRFSFRNEFD
jgi:hypothetical protein